MIDSRFLAWCGVCLLATVAGAVDNSDVKVMSFNVRYGTAKDGDNHWDLRKEVVAQTVKAFSPDVMGTQEIMPFQAKFLQESLADYTYVGTSRVPADPNQEQCGIFFLRDRFYKLEEGHFWLSTSPDVPGSQGWDAALPRMVSWVKLFDQKNERTFYFFNTHFDHRGEQARNESGALLAQRIQRLDPQACVIVTGDFNCGEGSAAHVKLTAQADGQLQLRDTLRTYRPNATDGEGTFNGFQGRDTGARIDWILASPAFEVKNAEIDKSSVDGRFPSDHFPVNATLEFAK
ncbi:MAG: endonuclease/exonuclease/phosphatase family protein [Pirellulaceae bacterium]